MARATADEVEAEFPDAVRAAKALRTVFGEGVKIIYARNAHGLEIGRKPKKAPYTHGDVSALDSSI